MSAQPQAPVAPVERLAFTIVEAAQSIGIGHTRMGDLVRAGRIGIVRIGKRIIIPRESLQQFLADNTDWPVEAL